MKIELVLSRSERVSAEITPSHHTAHLLTLRLSPVHRQSSQALNTKRLHAMIKIEKKEKSKQRGSVSVCCSAGCSLIISSCVSERNQDVLHFLMMKQLIDTVYTRFPASWLKVNITSPSITYDPSFCLWDILMSANKFNTQVTLHRKYTK